MRRNIANCKLHAVKPRPVVAPCVFPRRAPTKGWSLALTTIALLFFVIGCGQKTDTAKSSSTKKNPALSTVERGPVKVTAEVQPAKARLSDEPTLTLTIEYEPGVQLEKPPFGASLGKFMVRDFHEPLPKTRNGREIIQQVYTLEPIETGKLTIDPISVTFTDLRPNGDEKTHTIETEALTVDVTSMLGDNAPSLTNLRPSAAPLALPSSISILVWLIIITCVLTAISGWWLWRRKRRATAGTVVILSPEDLALLELEILAQSRLAETDVKQFFVEITAIVRRYIERTTGIRAPEQTTEEFLHEISRAKNKMGDCLDFRVNENGTVPFGPILFNLDTNERLRDFLESADLVKFAAHQPRPEDIDESFSRARIFITLKSKQAASMHQEAAV